MNRRLAILMFAVVAATAMEKAESDHKELSLAEKISLLEAYMYGNLTIKNIAIPNEGERPHVCFHDFKSSSKAEYVVRLRDAILCLSEAKKGYKPIYSSKANMNDDVIFELQRLRWYNWHCLKADLPTNINYYRLEYVGVARENWQYRFLHQGVKELIEKELKNKSIFRSRFIPLEKVLCAPRENILLAGCERENSSTCTIS